MQILFALSKLGKSDLSYDEEIYELFLTRYNRRLRLQGCKAFCDVNASDASEFFNQLYEHAEEMLSDFMQYLVKINDLENSQHYKYNLPILVFKVLLFRF